MASSLSTLLARLAKLRQGNPHDAGLATAMQNAQYQMSDLDRSYKRGNEGIQSQYKLAGTQLGEDRDLSKTSAANRFADQGMGFSGIRAGEEGKIEKQYQTGLSGAVQRRLDQLNALSESKRGAESGIQQMLVGAQNDYTTRQQQAAQAQAAVKAQAAAQAEQNRMMAAQAAAMRAMAAQAAAGYGGGGGGGGGGGLPQGPSQADQWARIRALKPLQDKWNYQWAIIKKTYGPEAALKFAYLNPRPAGAPPKGGAFEKELYQVSIAAAMNKARANKNKSGGWLKSRGIN